MKPLSEVASECRLLDFNQLVEVQYTAPHETTTDIEGCALRLVLRTESGDRRLAIECTGVERFSLNGVGGGVTQIMGLAVDDWTGRQMANIRWRVYDFEDGRIEVLCSEVDAQVDEGW